MSILSLFHMVTKFGTTQCHKAKATASVQNVLYKKIYFVVNMLCIIKKTITPRTGSLRTEEVSLQ
jgi:hypothetical protein